MLVTFTNASSEQKMVSSLYKVLDPGESVTTSRSTSDLSHERQLLVDIESGDITVSFAPEAGDSAPVGPPGTLESFANAAALPAPADRPLFTTVWQIDAMLAVWTDGTNWRTAAGAITA
jgi:hypothetical protein